MQKRSFETVITDHGATVLRVCLAVLGPADADDAWSETFLSAMKAYPELPADANVEAWLVTIAHRKAIAPRPHVSAVGGVYRPRRVHLADRPRRPPPRSRDNRDSMTLLPPDEVASEPVVCTPHRARPAEPGPGT